MDKSEVTPGERYAARPNADSDEFYQVDVHEWAADLKAWTVTYPAEPFPEAPRHLKGKFLVCEWARLDDWRFDEHAYAETAAAVPISLALNIFDMALGHGRSWLDYQAAKDRAAAEAYASLADVTLRPDDVIELRYRRYRTALIRPDALTRIGQGFARKHREQLPALLDGPLMGDGGGRRYPPSDYSHLYRTVPAYVGAMRLAKSWVAEETPHGPKVDGERIGREMAERVGSGLNAHHNSTAYRASWQDWHFFVGLEGGALGYVTSGAETVTMFKAAMYAAQKVQWSFPES